MATTKNGRIEKLIAANKAAAKRDTGNREAERPRMSRTMSHTVITKNKETGEVIKNKVDIVVIINTHGRGERRGREIMRLEEALKGASKKGRMRKFAHKKDKAKDDKPKKGKGKK